MRMHSLENRKLIIFDKDKTICQNKNDPEDFIHSVDEQELIPGVLEECKKLKTQGIELAIASNQGGVAFGHVSNFVVYRIIEHAKKLLDANYAVWSPHHPEGSVKGFIEDHWDRKPRPGMLIRLMCKAEAEPDEVLMVGDSAEDMEAAERAGVDFEWAHNFFDRV